MMWEVSIAVVLLALLAASLEVGFLVGHRALELGRQATSGVQLGAIQGAMLGLLGLLLGFSFAGASSRYMERQDLIVRDANAIGTAYLRADMLGEPYRSQLRKVLAEYVQHRVEASQNLSRGVSEKVLAEVDQFHRRIWKVTREGVTAKPSAMLAVLMPVNELIDLNATRLAASRKHLPSLIMGLLVCCSMVAVGTIGFACGLAGGRSLPMTLSLVFLVAAALWTTIDMDYSRAGLIRLNDAPMEDLEESFQRSEGARTTTPASNENVRELPREYVLYSMEAGLVDTVSAGALVAVPPDERRCSSIHR